MVFSRCEDIARNRTTRGTSSMDSRERGSHERGVYPTQYTSRMETARVKEAVRADTRVRVKEKYEIRNVGTIRGKSPKQDLTSAKDLPIELPEGRETPYHRLD